MFFACLLLCRCEQREIIQTAVVRIYLTSFSKLELGHDVH